MNHFFEINLDISLGMDSNCILIALFELCVCVFFVICAHYHHVHGNLNPYNWYQSKAVILRMD